jgi:hypothetical protein
MFDRLFGLFTRVITSAERDRLSLKFDALECRMDKLEICQAETKSELRAIHEIGLANAELLEGKLNLSKANQEVIKDLIDTRFTLLGRSFEDLKILVTERRSP